MIRRARSTWRKVRTRIRRARPRRGRVVAADGSVWFVRRAWLPRWRDRQRSNDGADTAYAGSGDDSDGSTQPDADATASDADASVSDASVSDASVSDWETSNWEASNSGPTSCDASGGSGDGIDFDLGDEILIVVVVLVALVALVFLLPVVLALLSVMAELALLLVLLPFAVAGRILFKRPWLVVAARADGGELVRAVVGYRAGGAAIAEAKRWLREAGLPFDPDRKPPRLAS